MARLSKEAKTQKILQALKKGPLSASQLVEKSGVAIEDLKVIAKELRDAGKIQTTGPGGKQLELVPKKVKAAPAPAKKTGGKLKKKAAPVEEDEDDEDEDEEDDDLDLDDDEEDEDDEDGSEEDDDEDEDEDDPDEDSDEDENDDDEEDEEEPAPKKKSKVAAKTPAPSKVFSIAFKPIDTLTDKELAKRITLGTDAAEEMEDEYPEIAELLMRSVARCRKQQRKRDA